MEGCRDYRIVVLADYSRKRLREAYRKHYRASRRKYGDDVLWVGYKDTYDPDGKMKCEFGYDGYAVTFDKSVFDHAHDHFEPRKAIDWDIYVVAVFKDGHYDVYGETFDRTFSDVLGDFTDHLDYMVEQLRKGNQAEQALPMTKQDWFDVVGSGIELSGELLRAFLTFGC